MRRQPISLLHILRMVEKTKRFCCLPNQTDYNRAPLKLFHCFVNRKRPNCSSSSTFAHLLSQHSIIRVKRVSRGPYNKGNNRKKNDYRLHPTHATGHFKECVKTSSVICLETANIVNLRNMRNRRRADQIVRNAMNTSDAAECSYTIASTTLGLGWVLTPAWEAVIIAAFAFIFIGLNG